MTTKKRFVVGHRHGPRLDQASIKELDTFLSQNAEASLVKRTLVGRTVAAMSEQQAKTLADANRQLVVEEDQPLVHFAMPGLPPRVPTGASHTLTVSVTSEATGEPIPNVTIYGSGESIAYRAVTDAQGKASLAALEPLLNRIVATPRDTYWSRVLPAMDLRRSGEISIGLKPLATTGAYDWGHRLMGFRRVNRFWTGKGVKIGVIDSGLASENQAVKATGGYNTLDGQDTNRWNVDDGGHGTHISGIIAARNAPNGLTGAAPDAEIFAVKAFPGGYLSDLVEAVEWCIRNQMDVINLSLGVSNPSQVLAGVFSDAYDRGITCVAAAGNDGKTVAYPAAFPNVLGVGAIGRFGTFPEDSAHTLAVSQFSDWRGGLFAAGFSNPGDEVDVCAPGVAICSTVPTGYAAWDGTSMATPLVSALVALILEAYAAIRTGTAQQAETVKAILFGASANLGMPRALQGRGLPLAPQALAAARVSPYTRQPATARGSASP